MDRWTEELERTQVIACWGIIHSKIKLECIYSPIDPGDGLPGIYREAAC